MATPTVFVSSTFYDLRYVRDGVKRFIEGLGYAPVLSEDGTVFFDPGTTAAEACLAEVGNADLFVLIIGGRYGSLMRDDTRSITNAEYQQAIARRIPVFALVESGTFSDYQLFRANAANQSALEGIVFPNADSSRIFEFISDVETQIENNALVAFSTVGDVESYLRSQWAGMMHHFLSRETSEAQVADSLEMLKQVNTRVEFLAERILLNVGSPIDRVNVKLLKLLVDSQAVHDLRFVGTRPTPLAVLENETLEGCLMDLNGPTLNIELDGEISISGSGDVSATKLEMWRDDYAKLRRALLETIEQADVTIEALKAAESSEPSKPALVK